MTKKLNKMIDDVAEHTMNAVRDNSLRASREAFAILDGLKSKELSLADAEEMNNSLGKVNGANANLIKQDLLRGAFEKLAIQHKTKHLGI